MQGALLLELYTRDGINGVCMIAADLYEGIRPAQLGDQAEVAALLGMLRESGYELPFPLSDLANRLDCVTVMEREGKVGAQPQAWGLVGVSEEPLPLRPPCKPAQMLRPRLRMFWPGCDGQQGHWWLCLGWKTVLPGNGGRGTSLPLRNPCRSRPLQS